MDWALSIPATLSGAPLPAGLDTFWILLVIALGSAANEWLKKRKRAGKTDSSPTESDSTRPPPPAHPVPTRPTATSHWEEELRRLLGGEPPVAKPPTIAPPPVRPVILQEPESSSAHRRGVALVSPARTVAPPLAGARIGEAEKAVAVHLPALAESISAYQRASHLHEGVAERLKRVAETTEHHPGKPPTVHRSTFPAETAQIIALIRNPRTARQAVVASLVLGTPRGLGAE